MLLFFLLFYKITFRGPPQGSQSGPKFANPDIAYILQPLTGTSPHDLTQYTHAMSLSSAKVDSFNIKRSMGFPTLHFRCLAATMWSCAQLVANVMTTQQLNNCIMPVHSLLYRVYTQMNGAVSIVNTIETAPFICVCPVHMAYDKCQNVIITSADFTFSAIARNPSVRQPVWQPPGSGKRTLT
jgi:hypothetical protein